MHKVININIGGRIFHLEENAFESLNKYVASLKQYFGDKPEGPEIVADIENRIAELLDIKIKETRNNITADDISEIVASMGSPKDIAGGDDERGHVSEKSAETVNTDIPVSGKAKIYRDPDGKVISGVCSGLAYYFDMDSTIVRLIFIALFFAGGSSIFIYAILWIVIPEAVTTAEKLAMRKEKINIDTIRKSVEDEFGRVKGAIDKGDYQGRIGNFFQKIFHVIGLVVKAAFKLVGIFIGVLFALAALSLFIGMVTLITGTTVMNGLHISLFDFASVSFFDNANDRLLFQVAIVSGLFSFILIFFNVSRSLLMSGRSYPNRKIFNRISGTMFFLSLLLCIISGAKTISYFRSEGSVEHRVKLDSLNRSYTISSFHSRHHGNGFFVENDSLRIMDIDLKIETTQGQAELVQIIESRGQNYNRALENASNCSYEMKINGSEIILPESFILKGGQPYRKQKIAFLLRLPAGSQFKVDKSVNLDIDGQTHDGYGIISGELYHVKPDGIHCENCSAIDSGVAMETGSYDFIYPAGRFNSINVSSNLKIKIVKGSYSKVMANGLNIQADLIVEEEDGELKIHLRNSFFRAMLDEVEVMVISPDLRNVKISGAVKAEIEGFHNQDMEIYCSGASSCRARLSSVNLVAEIQGASELDLSGEVTTLDLEVEGASNVDASELKARNVYVKVSGASDADVNASGSLKARSSGAGTIRYYGNPGVADCTSSGAGKIVKKD